ncbi:hypothetical protein PENTCL1PPCAC_17745, partial [Pristionchus entomophagus]
APSPLPPPPSPFSPLTSPFRLLLLFPSTSPHFPIHSTSTSSLDAHSQRHLTCNLSFINEIIIYSSSSYTHNVHTINWQFWHRSQNTVYSDNCSSLPPFTSPPPPPPPPSTLSTNYIQLMPHSSIPSSFAPPTTTSHLQ